MLINKKSQTDLSGFYVVFNGSVLNEDATNYGISHLCEHLKCRMYNKLYDEFDRYNVTWNAYTSDEYIVFYIKGLDEYINKYKNEFLECLTKKFNISKEDFEIEKKVVIEEYKDYFQDQSANFYANICRKQYHSYGAIGKLQSLENIKYDDLKKYWNKYLLLPYKIINVSKNNEFKTNIKFNDEIKTHYIPDKKDKLILENKIDYDKVAVIGYILLSENFPYNKICYVLDMLGLNSLSPFWNELREKQGLTYGVSTWVDSLSLNQGIASSSLITTPTNVKKVLKTYKGILTNIEKYLTKERFEIVKDYYTIKKKRDEIELYQNIDDYLMNDNWNVDKILDTITYDECKEIFNKYLTFDKWIFETDNNITNECLTFDKWINNE